MYFLEYCTIDFWLKVRVSDAHKWREVSLSPVVRVSYHMLCAEKLNELMKGQEKIRFLDEISYDRWMMSVC